MIESTLERALRALEPILDRIVVVGGVAHRLHALQADPDFIPLTTADVDLAVHTEGDGPDLLEAFRTARFRETLRGAEHPPSRICETDGSEYVQFVANRHGGADGRTGERPAIVEFHGQFTETLLFADVLLRSPWTVHVGSGNDALEVQVVNPAAFVLQKGLIFNSRAPADQAKDVLYVHDTFNLFDPADLDVGTRLYRVKIAVVIESRAAERTIERGDTSITASLGPLETGKVAWERIDVTRAPRTLGPGHSFPDSHVR